MPFKTKRGEIQTRRERNAKGGHETETVHVPASQQYLAEMFFEFRSFYQNYDEPIKPSLITDLGYCLPIEDRDIIFAMDRSYRRGFSDMVEYAKDK